MKYDDILSKEENNPSTLSEPVSGVIRAVPVSHCGSPVLSTDNLPFVSQAELEAECYTLEESKALLKAKVHNHFLNV